MTKNKTCEEVPIVDIEISTESLFEYFGHEDTVAAVRKIIKFCIIENNNEWVSINKEAINKFCLKHFKRKFYASRLVTSGYLEYRNGEYYITDKLFELCQKNIKYKVRPP